MWPVAVFFYSASYV